MYKAGHLTLDCTIGEQNNKEIKQQNKIRKCSKTLQNPLHTCTTAYINIP